LTFLSTRAPQADDPIHPAAHGIASGEDLIADPAHCQPSLLAVLETGIGLAKDRTFKKDRRRCEGDSVLAPVDASLAGSTSTAIT
jgi:hypothetical protein